MTVSIPGVNTRKYKLLRITILYEGPPAPLASSCILYAKGEEERERRTVGKNHL